MCISPPLIQCRVTLGPDALTGCHCFTGHKWAHTTGNLQLSVRLGVHLRTAEGNQRTLMEPKRTQQKQAIIHTVCLCLSELSLWDGKVAGLRPASAKSSGLWALEQSARALADGQLGPLRVAALRCWACAHLCVCDGESDAAGEGRISPCGSIKCCYYTLRILKHLITGLWMPKTWT